MATEFSLDMNKASDRIITFIVTGKIDDARLEIGWIKDHSKETPIRNKLIAELERDLESLFQSGNVLQTTTRAEALVRAAVEAGPTDMDKALMRY
ncbi:hypothetical protein F9K90_07605 [Brucella anthropi]|uniref:hypothetical protein n=1 Tax=Brucella anthropi TaxID=529 RepID=UPI00124F0000|nr:hypothetical protein [Brucella anthropi]KAB2738537.1 hypothetical protein F9K90_07605 [Brucella anthropi]